MPSASLFIVCSIIGPFDKAKLQMFSPLFTKVTVAENKMEVTAPGLPRLASSNTVQEWLLLEELNQYKLWRMTLLGSSAIQTGKEARVGALESCHPLPSVNHGVPFPLCCAICFLRPATHMETWTHHTKSVIPATPGISQACRIYTSVSANSAAFWGGDKTAVLKAEVHRSQANILWVHKINKNSQLLLAGCPAKFSPYGYTYFTANSYFFNFSKAGAYEGKHHNAWSLGLHFK